MKKILLLILAVLANISVVHALDYTVREITSNVTVTDLSTCFGNVFELKIPQNAYNSSGTKYASTATVYIYPKKHSIVGYFSVDDYTIHSDSFVKYGSNADRYLLSGSYLTIEDLGQGKYSISGYVTTKPTTGSTKYNYTYTVNTSKNYCIFSTKDGGKADLYGTEPAAGSFDVSDVEYITKSTADIPGCLTLDICKGNNTLELSFVTSGSIPAGTYSITDSKADGTVLASAGLHMDPIYNQPCPSFYQELDDWFSLKGNYFLTGGEIKVAYSEGGKKMTVSGTATSHNGSSVSINATGDNPFYVPGGETIELTVSSITAEAGEDSFGKCFTFSIAAKNGNENCNGEVCTGTTSFTGEFGDEDFRATKTWFGNTSNLIKSDIENSAVITATGNTDEYMMNLRISCADNNIYVIKNAVFTYVPPTPPGPFDPEPDEVSSFVVDFPSEPYVSKSGNIIELCFNNGDLDFINLSFATGDEGLLPARYQVSGSKAPGTVIASEGRKKIEEVDTETWSHFGKDHGVMDYIPYYLTEGYVDVGYDHDNVVLSGKFTTAKGSTVNFTAKGPCSEFCSAPLPFNVSNGYLSGTDVKYIMATDVYTEPDGSVNFDASVMPEQQIPGFTVSVSVNGKEPVQMSWDSATGRCGINAGKHTRGEKLNFSLILDYEGGSTRTRTVEYVVE